MKFTVNLEEELLKENAYNQEQNLALTQAREILENSEKEDLEIISGFFGNIENIKLAVKEDETSRKYNFLDPKRIFKISQIKNTCVKYRLRFLSSQLYKGSLPREVILKVKDLRKDLVDKKYLMPHEKSGFELFIMAPTSAFRLEERPKDPLLFLKLSNDTFYLIHKWGNDLSLFRKIKYFPTRTIMSIILSLLVISFVPTFAVFLKVEGFKISGLFASLFLSMIITFFSLLICAFFDVDINKDVWDKPFK